MINEGKALISFFAGSSRWRPKWREFLQGLLFCSRCFLQDVQMAKINNLHMTTGILCQKENGWLSCKYAQIINNKRSIVIESSYQQSISLLWRNCRTSCLVRGFPRFFGATVIYVFMNNAGSFFSNIPYSQNVEQFFFDNQTLMFYTRSYSAIYFLFI